MRNRFRECPLRPSAGPCDLALHLGTMPPVHEEVQNQAWPALSSQPGTGTWGCVTLICWGGFPNTSPRASTSDLARYLPDPPKPPSSHLVFQPRSQMPTDDGGGSTWLQTRPWKPAGASGSQTPPNRAPCGGPSNVGCFLTRAQVILGRVGPAFPGTSGGVSI